MKATFATALLGAAEAVNVSRSSFGARHGHHTAFASGYDPHYGAFYYPYQFPTHSSYYNHYGYHTFDSYHGSPIIARDYNTSPYDDEPLTLIHLRPEKIVIDSTDSNSDSEEGIYGHTSSDSHS